MITGQNGRPRTAIQQCYYLLLLIFTNITSPRLLSFFTRRSLLPVVATTTTTTKITTSSDDQFSTLLFLVSTYFCCSLIYSTFFLSLTALNCVVRDRRSTEQERQEHGCWPRRIPYVSFHRTGFFRKPCLCFVLGCFW